MTGRPDFLPRRISCSVSMLPGSRSPHPGRALRNVGFKGVLEEGRLTNTPSSHPVRPIGRVQSPLKRLADAPRQGHEGAPDAWLQIEPAFRAGLDGIRAGQDIFILTWLHEARRDVLAVHPRDDPAQPLAGVFATRSPDRPNPIGLHRVRVLAIEAGGSLQVQGLEAIDGTPIIDIKPVLRGPRPGRQPMERGC